MLLCSYNMMFGDFDMSAFDNFHGDFYWVGTLFIFVIFMMLVPTVMMNALIAIMVIVTHCQLLRTV